MNTLQFQIARFSTGGFALHRVTSSQFAGRCSAWFDPKGELIDAEQFDSRNRGRPVKRDGPVWRHLQTVGQRYVQTV